MKKNIFLNSLIGLAALCVAALPLASCSDDDPVRNPITSPSAEQKDVTPHTLTFHWDATDGETIQYGYQLLNPAGDEVAMGTTTKTSLKFTGLQPSTEYTLKVKAFPAVENECAGASDFMVLKATTADVVLLPTVTNVAQTSSGGSTTFTWDAVDNAEAYEYRLSTAEGEIVPATVTYDTTVTVPDLGMGDYDFTVRALPTDDDDWNVASEPAKLAFSITNTLLWEHEGTFLMDAYPDYPWKANISYFSDGVYKITSWYLAEGYDLTFTVNDAGVVTFMNVENDGTYDYLMGNSSAYFYVVIGTATCKLNGESGQLLFNSYYDGDITFTWGDMATELWRTEGTFTVYGYDGEPYNGYNPWKSTMVAYSDGSYVVENWYGYGVDLKFSVNEDTSLHFLDYSAENEYNGSKTVTISYGGGYTTNAYQDCYSEFITSDEPGASSFYFYDSWCSYKFVW